MCFRVNKLILIITIVMISYCNSQTINTVDEAINTAINQNPQVAAARLEIEKAETIKLKSFNIPKPEIFMELEGINGNISNYESRKIGIAQEFDFPTIYFNRSNFQSSHILIAKAELNKLLNDLSIEIKQKYYSLAISIRMMETYRKNLNIYNDFVNVAERKFEAGESSNLEILNAKLNKIKFENNVKDLETKVKTLQAELKKLMNSEHTLIPADDPGFTEMNLNKDKLILTAFTKNPELLIVQGQKESEQRKISLTRSELLPSFSLRYYNQKIVNESGLWGIELGVGLPLWFWGEPSGNIKEANIEYQITEKRELDIKNSITTDLSIYFEEYLNSLSQIQFIQNEAIPASNEILRQAKISYEEGAIEYTEYLQALNTAFESSQQYNELLLSYFLTLTEIEKITGEKII